MATNVQKKKKKWYKIYAPEYFKGYVIGESIVGDPNSLIGKNISLNLMELTNDPKKQNFRIIFKVSRIDGEKALTELTGYEMLLTHVKRMMRKGIEKIEDSFKLKSKDNVNMQIKPMLLTKNKTKHSVLTAIRKLTVDFISNELKNQTFEEFMSSVMSNKTQKQLRENIAKIYPLVACEFRIVKKA
ncbi:hypothetical protein J4231_01850 [Candidatus Woesearchaeota archaeon]|nr:hypothetical protein [Candidatus Woesearchaeota archaeon]